jgi:ureidoacrylate peracid hydrolase
VVRMVTLDAKPEPIAVDPETTAIIVIDMQNDFGSKGGMFDRAGIDISSIQQAVGPTARVAIQCVDATTPNVPSISGRVVNGLGAVIVYR